MKIQAYAILILLALSGALGWVALHEYGITQADAASCTALRTADAKAADDAVAKAVRDQTDKDALAAEQIRQDQAKADQDHERVMLRIQHAQDTATHHFEDANHDQAAVAWAAQPVPLDYYLGLCAALGDRAGCPGDAAAHAVAQSGSARPRADGGDAAQPATHGQPAADHPAAGQGAGQLQR